MNIVTLIGRTTKDFELRFIGGSGQAVANNTLAVKNPYKKDDTDFINIVAFGKTAETLAQYVTKGQRIAINGRIKTSSFDKTDGTKGYRTDIIIDKFDFLEKATTVNGENFGGVQDMTPCDDGDIPF